MASPKIILYTNRGCPWAHRAHIALKELGLQYEEVTIDLSVPREPWYLEVNPVCSCTSVPHQQLVRWLLPCREGLRLCAMFLRTER